MKRAWVYILQCADGSHYTGCTTDIDQRVAKHQGGEVPGYTQTRRPVKLLWCDEFPDVVQAAQVERQIKGWSRAKKEALMKGDFDAIHELAKSSSTKARLCKEADGGQPSR